MSTKYKMKTHSGAKRRFSVSGGGKFLRRKHQISHLRRRKSRHARRLFSEMVPVSRSHTKALRRLLPYGRS